MACFAHSLPVIESKDIIQQIDTTTPSPGKTQMVSASGANRWSSTDAAIIDETIPVYSLFSPSLDVAACSARSACSLYISIKVACSGSSFISLPQDSLVFASPHLDFSANQIYLLPATRDVNPDERDAACQAWFDHTASEICYGNRRAYCAREPVCIQPLRDPQRAWRPPHRQRNANSTSTGSVATPCRQPPRARADVSGGRPSQAYGFPQRRESTAPFSFAKVFVELIEPFTELLYGRTASILNQLIENLLERLLDGVCLVGNDPRRAV